ncbi:MAG: TRAP transporter large permease [Spirochaetaceae bacterium]|nr:MAG: TRAP transporter large permease [Spirochaetaceae bacterium]
MFYVLLIFVTLIALIFAGIPVFLATLITSILFMIILDLPFSIIIIRVFGGIDSFSLMAIPFFILAGNIMMEAKITDKIVEFSNAMVGQFKGGLGHINIVSSMFFAGIQGSGAADASAIGSVLIPSMTKQGYGRDYAVAVTASSSMIGPIIPPSIAMIMYAYYTDLSVGRLFLGGFVPGVIVGLGLMAVHAVFYRIRKYDFPTRRFDIRYFLQTLKRSALALIMPFIILFGIVFGVFTPTESGIIASLYGLVYGFFFSRELTVKKLPKIMIDSATMTAVVMITIAMAGVLSNILVRLHFQSNMINFALETVGNRHMASLLIMVFMLILGCFLDPTVLIAMFAAPVLAAGTAMGFDPIHFGVFAVVAMQLGAITPPVGTFLFISSSIAGIPLEKAVRAMLPFFTLILIVTLLILFIPGLTLGVVGLFFP